MPAGNIAFNAPESMTLDDTAHIQLLLSLDKSVEQLRNDVAEAGRKEGATVKVSDIMDARLVGPDFDITAVTPEEQPVTSKGTTEWLWDVKPKTDGDRTLHLTLLAVLEVNGQRASRNIRSFSKDITVSVTPVQWMGRLVSSKWDWLWAAIIVPLAGFAGNLWRLRIKRGRSASEVDSAAQPGAGAESGSAAEPK